MRLWLNQFERNRFTATHGYYGIAVDQPAAQTTEATHG
jgi:hypothetical protein